MDESLYNEKKTLNIKYSKAITANTCVFLVSSLDIFPRDTGDPSLPCIINVTVKIHLQY